MQLFIMPFFLITVTLTVPCFFVFTLIAESVFAKNFCMRAGCYGQGTKSDSYGKIVDALSAENQKAMLKKILNLQKSTKLF